MGEMWRRRLLFDLLGAPGAASAAIDMFERDPSIGMIGPKVFRLPKANYPEDLSWSANRPMTLKIAERMGVPADKFQLDFFGGTMFWVRPEALKPLRDLRLAADMPYESGLIDGDLPHALERVLPTSVLVAGYKLADSDGYEAHPSAGRNDRDCAFDWSSPASRSRPRLNALASNRACMSGGRTQQRLPRMRLT